MRCRRIRQASRSWQGSEAAFETWSIIRGKNLSSLSTTLTKKNPLETWPHPRHQSKITYLFAFLESVAIIKLEINRIVLAQGTHTHLRLLWVDLYRINSNLRSNVGNGHENLSVYWISHVSRGASLQDLLVLRPELIPLHVNNTTRCT